MTTVLRSGTRVRIIRENFGHVGLGCLFWATGTITEVCQPHAGRREWRYEVTFDKPRGDRGYRNHFPLYRDDLEILG